MSEPIIEPDLPIIDPHHHLWDLRPVVDMLPEPRHHFIAGLLDKAYYTFDQVEADLNSGHNIVGTIFVECGAFYRAGASDAMKVVGEVEYANGIAAQSASGLYGPTRLCAGIVGHADLTLGEDVYPVLEALQASAPSRLKGIRHQGAWDRNPDVLGPAFHIPQHLYRDRRFRDGFGQLQKFGLSFDAWVLEPQLEDVIDLARAFPNQPICLDHCGTPLGVAQYTGTHSERFDTWRQAIEKLARCENVMVKLGGLAMSFCGLPDKGPAVGYSSEQLLALWQPYLDVCINAFGPQRAMFESNYPVDHWGASYPVLWNTFKRAVSGASNDEKRALFAGSAAQFYRVEHILPAA